MRIMWVVLMLLAGCAKPDSFDPDFYDTNASPYSYQDFKGKWLVINYWATWCAPCIKEIPELIELDENNLDVAVLGVNFDAPTGDDVKRDIDKMKITFPVMQKSPHEYFGIELPEVLPTTLLVSPEGILETILIGPQTQESLLAAMDES